MTGPLPRHLLPDGAVVDVAGRLTVAGCDLVDLAGRFGTPLIVYDEDHLRARCGEARAAFGEGAVAYAAKAFLCRAMVELVHEERLHLDVSTGGEMNAALAAGFPPERLVLHGNYKPIEELATAVEAQVGRIVVDGFEELDRLDTLAAERGCRPPVLLRVTPGVEAHTHVYLSTGCDDSKFGFTVSTGAAAEAVARARSSDSVELMGIHAHIGSQVFRLDSFARAVATLADFANPLGLPELSVGGGLGVAYVTGEEAPTITEWGRTVLQAAAEAGVTARLSVEPGRAIVAAAAITLYKVGAVKGIPGIRTYVAVDGGLSDNPRPVLYGSGYEAFLPRAADAARPQQVRVVGRNCESGDVLVADGHLPHDVADGDILAIPVAGAYGYSMASNYNKMPRPAVVFVRDGEARPVIRRETFDDLLRLDL
ncbi:MAG: diaminopimelate decarboxylase [Acidimicrobiia bacterium]|nr:diaminopimelate decarboxylase [Acidimicrobiia bacterium]MYJ14349.1 diaminopimelate decarboxylase [Acidimicrobiia bacterium]